MEIFSSAHSGFLNKRFGDLGLREVLWRELCFVLESKEILPLTSLWCAILISLESGGLFGLNSCFSYLGNVTNLPGIRGNSVAKCVC